MTEYRMCEICAMGSVETPATSKVWLHKALGNADCRWVAVCDECKTESDSYDSTRDMDEEELHCAQCHP